ncbi:MAG: hypothetical protein IPK80_01035 [Nannocystis sp.]|nr:hypothetical protein [Nannocystis sp.]
MDDLRLSVVIAGDPGAEGVGPLLLQFEALLSAGPLFGELVFAAARPAVQLGPLRRGERGEIVVEPPEEGRGGGREHGAGAAFAGPRFVEAIGADEREGAVAAVELLGEPVGDDVDGDPALVGAQLGQVVEDDGVDRGEQTVDLRPGDKVTSLRARLGAVVFGPEVDAGEIGVFGEQLIPGFAVEGPSLRDERGDDVGLVCAPALREVELVEGLDVEVATLAEEELGLGDYVVGLAGVLGLDDRRGAKGVDELAAAGERVEDPLGRADAVVSERAELLALPGVALGLGEVHEGGVELGPEGGGPRRIIGADGGEVAADAAA